MNSRTSKIFAALSIGSNSVSGQNESPKCSNNNPHVVSQATQSSDIEDGIMKSCNSKVTEFEEVQENLNLMSTLIKYPTCGASPERFHQLETNIEHQENLHEPVHNKEEHNSSGTLQNPNNRETISFVISNYFEDPPTPHPAVNDSSHVSRDKENIFCHTENTYIESVGSHASLIEPESDTHLSEEHCEGALRTKPDSYFAINEVATCEENGPSTSHVSSLSSSSSCSTCSDDSSSSSSTENSVDDDDADPTFVVTNDCPTDESSTSDESTVPDEVTLNTKKRKRKPGEWQKALAKKLRNSGQEYHSLKTGKLQPAKKMLEPCEIEKCRFKCQHTFSEEERQILFKKFWALGDLQLQRNYILGQMQIIQPSRRLVLNRKKDRGPNYSYFFRKNEKQVFVCFKFFRSTLSVSERFVRTVKAKNDNGFLDREKRGLKPSNKLPQEITNGIRKHLASIPAIESHYVRANTQRKFIDGSKNLSDLYRDYLEMCNETNTPPGKYSMYRHIFLFEFNMSFHSPKKDQCQTCETFKNSNPEEKSALDDSYKTHIREKELSREEKNLDKTLISDDYKGACFDLQAALPTPKGDVNSFYYKSRLNSYNFTVCQLEKKGLGPVQCYFWHEGEGKRGANEIGSSLLHYLRKTSEAADSPDLDIVLYSDNCGGQGKNKFIVSAFLYAVANYSIRSITHKFLVVGHGQNEGDASHSVIEKAVKKALKNGLIYLPTQYATIINNAKKKGSRFLVNELAHGDFHDLKNLHQGIVNNDFNRDSNGIKFNFNNISIIRFEKEHLDRFFFKTSYSDTQFRCVIVNNVTKTRKSALKNVRGFELLPAYSQSIPIGKKKFDDLQSLIKNRSIPRVHVPFFENLKHEKN